MKLWKFLLPSLLTVGGLLLTAGQSGAAPITGGNTTVALNSGTVSALVGLGFSITPISPASLTGLNAVFPITGGDTTSNVLHSGGLEFTKSGVKTDLTNFNINLSTNILTGNVNGGSTSVNFFDVGAGGALTLDPTLAAALVSIYGVPNLSGAAIGTATVSANVAPEPTSAALLLSACAGIGGVLRLRRKTA